MKRRVNLDFASSTLNTTYVWVRDADTHSLIGSITGYGNPPQKWRYDSMKLGPSYRGDSMASVLLAAELEVITSDSRVVR